MARANRPAGPTPIPRAQRRWTQCLTPACILRLRPTCRHVGLDGNPPACMREWPREGPESFVNRAPRSQWGSLHRLQVQRLASILIPFTPSISPQIQIYSQTHVRSMTDQPRPSPDHSQNLSGGQANAGSADPRSGRIERPKRCRDQGAQPLCGPLGALFDAQSRQAAHGFGSTPASFLHAQGAAIVTTLEWRAANRQTYHLELGVCICTAASVVEPRNRPR